MGSYSGRSRDSSVRELVAHESDARTVPVPLHDTISEGTLREIADQAGAKDFQAFKAWIDRNR